MKLTNLLFFVGSALLAASFSSCVDNNMAEEEKEGVAVQTIEASINFDLSARSNWILIMSGYAYHFTTEGNKLFGSAPITEPYRFGYKLEWSNGASEITLSPRPAETDTRMSYVPRPIPKTIDQSTAELFIYYDMLRGPYIGHVVENLSGITLYHQNALLHFHTVNIPEDGKVYVRHISDQTITPLRDEQDPTEYRAIVRPDNDLEDIFILVETASKTYETVLRAPVTNRSLPYNFDSIGNGTIITFNARIDAEDKLVIEKLQMSDVFAKEWPITQ